ncbi:UNVERIFIED_CONTAM: hypothetical protein K2H54_044914 [Gekko kuhli]
MKPQLDTSTIHSEWTTGLSVRQLQGTLTVTEGNRILLECSYDDTSAGQYYPFWYVQHPGQPPKLFLRDVGQSLLGDGIRQGFKAEHVKKNKTFHMWRPASQLSDSAVYFCSVSDTVKLVGREAEQKHSGRGGGVQTGALTR